MAISFMLLYLSHTLDSGNAINGYLVLYSSCISSISGSISDPLYRYNVDLPPYIRMEESLYGSSLHRYNI